MDKRKAICCMQREPRTLKVKTKKRVDKIVKIAADLGVKCVVNIITVAKYGGVIKSIRAESDIYVNNRDFSDYEDYFNIA